MPVDFPRKRHNRISTAVETNLTPRQLGAFLRGKYDVALLGERHDSQAVLDANKEIFYGFKASVLFAERDRTFQISDNSQVKETSAYGPSSPVHEAGAKAGVPVVGVDLPDYTSYKRGRSVIALLRILDGEDAAVYHARHMCILEARSNGADVTMLKNLKFPSEPKERKRFADDLMDRFLEKAGTAVSESNRMLHKDAVADRDRAGRSDVISRATSKIEKAWSTRMHFSAELETRNKAMAEGIFSGIETQRSNREFHGAAMAVGSDHNRGIEEILEANGLRVANIKTLVSTNPAMHGKVFRNQHAGVKSDAEWVVAVYDDKKLVIPPDFEAEFKVSGTTAPRNPTDIPSAKSAPKHAK